MQHDYVRVPVNNNSQGWGVAAFVVLLAVAAAFGAWTIHKRTYQHPRAPITMPHSALPGPALFVG